MADANLTMIRGDTAAFGVVYDGTTQDLDSAYFTIKKDWSDISPIVQKSIGDGIAKADTSAYIVRVAPDDTEVLEPGFYVYDLQLSLNNDVFTFLRGTLQIKADATY